MVIGHILFYCLKTPYLACLYWKNEFISKFKILKVLDLQYEFLYKCNSLFSPSTVVFEEHLPSSHFMGARRHISMTFLGSCSTTDLPKINLHQTLKLMLGTSERIDKTTAEHFCIYQPANE